ncbi:MAG: hypothetical protein H7138_26635, partial [Myxococcales bacterium]|nr:hypothetical protein [Myxococcales bacterium]
MKFAASVVPGEVVYGKSSSRWGLRPIPILRQALGNGCGCASPDCRSDLLYARRHGHHWSSSMFTAARAAGAGTYLMLAACSALLCACGARQGGPRGGTALLDEEIMLVREASSDVARHELVVTEPMTLVAFAEELDTQVRLRLETAGAATASVEVENNFKGTGIEVAALTVPRGARVVVTLDGPQDRAHPGRVRLRLRGFDA